MRRLFKPVARLLFLFWLCTLSPLSNSATESEFELEQIADGLGIPWGLAFLSEDRLLITEREGGVKLLDLPGNKITSLKMRHRSLPMAREACWMLRCPWKTLSGFILPMLAVHHACIQPYWREHRLMGMH